MNELTNKVANALIELRNASAKIKDTDYIIQKYKMLFMGKYFNIIYSNELLATLNDYFHIDIAKEQLDELLPSVCASLNMECRLLNQDYVKHEIILR